MFEYPEFLKNIKEIKSLYDVCDLEETKIQSACDLINDAKRVDDMSKLDIARLIQSINIKGLNRFDINAKKKILKLHFEMIPNYTETKIRNFFDGLIGNKNYSITINEKEMLATIEISMKLYELDTAIRTIFDELIPMNYRIEFKAFAKEKSELDLKYGSFMIVKKKVNLEAIE